MTWTRLSDDFADRPDVLELSESAIATHVRALVWCNKHLTDGRVPAGAVALVTRSQPDVIAELVDVGMWTPDGTAYLLDWSDQEDAERVVDRRDEWRRRDERRRLHNKGDHSTCDPKRCRVLLTRETPRETRRDSTRVSPPPAPAPVPTPREGRGRGAEVASARSAGAPLAALPAPEGQEPWRMYLTPMVLEEGDDE